MFRSGSVMIVGAAFAGALGGLVTTALALKSLEFGVFGAIGAAVATAIAAAIHVERSEALRPERARA